jgi:hypothetical protein
MPTVYTSDDERFFPSSTSFILPAFTVRSSLTYQVLVGELRPALFIAP